MKAYEKVSTMTPLPVMVFLLTLLLPSMHTDGRVLTQTQNESTISSNHKTDNKAVLDKTDRQDKGNKQAPEKVFCASIEDQTLVEDLATANQHKLILSKDKMSQSTQKHQVDSVNLNHMASRLQGTRVRHQEDSSKRKVMVCLEEFLELVKKTLVSH
ncbi:exocrine gland-secreted peptide 1-like [Mus caroli]|uniref:Exocrine gland-secreted peptide 1-like n=1 Tax=Mus caroli TaxID=10089 RepID=A0A6P5R8B9_MUSCR|nr:exocrine gland-secreted peptide 1-like [Mus caroli]